MKSKPSIAIIGPGNLGSALALALHEAGYRIEEIVSRISAESRRRATRIATRVGAKSRTVQNASFSAGIIWFCVKDDAIAPCAELLKSATAWKKKIALHSSGALSSDELAVLRRVGASVASIHPMMSFVRNIEPSLDGVTFAVEGDTVAVRVVRGIAKDLKGNVIAIRKRDKTLYHAWGAFISPLVISNLALAEQVAMKAGISQRSARRSMRPILLQTINNYLARGAGAAFSGPIVRGDTDTVRRHLKALASVPEAQDVYLALARAAIRNLPIGRKKELIELLK